MSMDWEATKQRNTGQLLFKAARLWNELAIQRIQALGVSELRFAHTQLFPHLGMDGIRATELARRIGISKQAIGQLIDDLVGMGVVERIADPCDGRAQLVRFTAAGQQSLSNGLAVLSEIESDILQQLGMTSLSQLQNLLRDIIPVLEQMNTTID